MTPSPKPQPVTSEPAQSFNLTPDAHVIASDDEAIAAARRLAAEFAAGAAERDRTRRLPAAELDAFSGSGLWGITIPKRASLEQNESEPCLVQARRRLGCSIRSR